MVSIRPEVSEDAADIRRVNEEAFDGTVEADLVDRLRQRQAFTFSLVAVYKGKIAGHILFSPVTIESENRSFPAVGLGPMAVLPAYQNRGIGSRLVSAGLQECRRLSFTSAIVLGHPNYYPRFGFVPASAYGIKCEYDVPDDVFMALELSKGALVERSGIAKYQPEFNEA